MSGRQERRLKKRERRRLRYSTGATLHIEGSRERTVPLDDETVEALKGMREEFIKKFGREPGPTDPIFFDPDADTPRPIDEDRLTADLTTVMVNAGIEPAKIYAWRKSGVMATEQNWSKMLPEDRDAWNDAIAEYERLTKAKQ